MSRLARVAVAVAGALLLGPLPGTSAAPARNALTLTGSGHVTAVLTLARTVTYDLDHAAAQYTGGDYAGFALGHDVVALWTPSYDVQRRRPIIDTRSSARNVLRPGRYRVHLFADEDTPTTITLPWDGPDTTLTPTTALDATVDIEQVLVTGTSPSAGVSVPQAASRAANLTAAAYYESLVAPTMSIKLCLTRTAGACGARPVWGMVMDGSGTALNGFGVGWGEYPSRTATRGTYVRGEISGTNAGVLTVLVLRYPR